MTVPGFTASVTLAGRAGPARRRSTVVGEHGAVVPQYGCNGVRCYCSGGILSQDCAWMFYGGWCSRDVWGNVADWECRPDGCSCDMIDVA